MALGATQGDENLHRPITNRPPDAILPHIAQTTEQPQEVAAEAAEKKPLESNRLQQRREPG